MFVLDRNRITHYYKIFGYLNLFFSILFIFLALEIDIIERLFVFIAINVGYHMCYWFFKSITKNRTAANDHFGKSFWKVANKAFSIFGMVCALFLAVSFISQSITLNKYYELLAICVPVGLFLGAYSSWAKMRNVDTG